MAKTYYTTSEAAKVLAVSPDAVLKWVRAGKINFYRTPGGHSRIPVDAINAILPDKDKLSGSKEPNEQNQSFRYCWDFYAGAGGIGEECLNCIAFKSRARRCYEMRDIPEEFGHLRLFCKNSCDECEYFQITQHRETTVLLVSRNRDWMEGVVKHSEESKLHVDSASNEYECSAKIEKIRPDYIVIDCAYGVSRTKSFCLNLANDMRIPYTRIILTSRTPRVKGYCDTAVFGWLRKPCKFEELSACIGQVRNAKPILTPTSGNEDIMH